MSEQTQAGVKNPYETDNMPEGGGLTREGVVTSAKYVMYPMKYKDGRPVVDAKTGEQSYFCGLQLMVLRVGDAKAEGKQDKYEWSAGKKARPSADGELLLDEKGNPAPIYRSSNLGDALFALEKGGFDKTTLYPRVSVLRGAKITFEGRNKVGADGKPKTHVHEGKTYNDIEWFPQTYKGGAGSRVAGNGAATGNGADLTTKAVDEVTKALIAAGGEMARKDVIQALGANLKGDADAIKITTMVARQDFHTGRPWTFDGTKLVLGGGAQ